MKLKDFKSLLEANRNKQFLIQLPNQNQVPVSFHITEVGQVSKTFIDCGGKVHSVQTCQLQAWVGDDIDHRIETDKMADILKIAASIVPNDDIDLEIEYEDTSISQYPVEDFTVTDDAVVLNLTTKHTDCLAKELCLVPSANGSSCCGPSCC
jgi:hypothetical protein